MFSSATDPWLPRSVPSDAPSSSPLCGDGRDTSGCLWETEEKRQDPDHSGFGSKAASSERRACLNVQAKRRTAPQLPITLAYCNTVFIALAPIWSHPVHLFTYLLPLPLAWNTRRARAVFYLQATVLGLEEISRDTGGVSKWRSKWANGCTTVGQEILICGVYKIE